MQRSTLVGALVMALGAAGVAPMRRSLNRQYDRHRAVLDTAQIPTLGVAKVASLGHVEWLSDVLWINALLYYGESMSARNPGRYIDRYASVMIGLDPHFRQAYVWAGVALSLRTRRVPIEDLRRAVEYLDHGLQIFPGDGELQLDQGSMLAFELAPRLPAGSDERRRVMARAAEHLRKASALGEGPPWLSLTASTMLVEAGRPDAAVEALRDALMHVDEADYRRLIEERIGSLQSARLGDGQGAQGIEQVEAARRREYPYLPTPLYLFVGPRVGG